MYTSHQSKEGPERDPLGQYVMNHRADVLCHVTDPEGNYFQVLSMIMSTVNIKCLTFLILYHINSFRFPMVMENLQNCDFYMIVV